MGPSRREQVLLNCGAREKVSLLVGYFFSICSSVFSYHLAGRMRSSFLNTFFRGFCIAEGRDLSLVMILIISHHDGR